MSEGVERAFVPTTGPRSQPIVLVPQVAPAVERRQRWQRQYRRRLAVTDLVVVVASVALASALQLTVLTPVDFSEVQSSPWPYFRVALITCVIWLIALMVFQTRAQKIIAHGTVEYRRVAQATAIAFGGVAIGFVILQSQGIRTQLMVALPVGMVALLVGRWVNRKWLVRQREAGEFVSRAIVVGSRSAVEYVTRSVSGRGVTGYNVVGVAVEGDDRDDVRVGANAVHCYGGVENAAEIAGRLEADAVIVASTPHGDSGYVKSLAWQLEGTASELVLSSPIADVAGPRMSLRPIEGLPLIQVEIPTFEGSRYALKRVLDVIVSSLALIVVGLATPFIALAIKLDSPGPVFFVQERVGRDGRTFRMAKFRSMHVGAHLDRDSLAAQNEGAGPLFKMRDDPRVTRVGAFLRRHSLDELPQFWNVFVGEMSAVGPRPPLPEEVTAYEGLVTRRLYIKPGVTGLWQISGRSDLSWDESIQLDLRYVENWSIMYDLTIMWRTAPTLFRSHGAY